MSGENLELVRRIYRDWERGEYSSTDWADPEIEFVLDTGLDTERAVGIKAMAETWGEFLDTWEGWRVKVQDCLELDHECVLVLLKPAALARGSGLEIGQIHTKGANVFHIRDGKVRRLGVYFDQDRAFADLGITESDLDLGEEGIS